MSANGNTRKIILDYIAEHGSITTAKAAEITDSARQNVQYHLTYCVKLGLLSVAPYPSMSGGKIYSLAHRELSPREYALMLAQKEGDVLVWMGEECTREEFLEHVESAREGAGPIGQMLIEDVAGLLNPESNARPSREDIEHKALILRWLAETYESFLDNPALWREAVQRRSA